MVRRLARRAVDTLRAGLVETGLLRYRPEVWADERWRWGYESGHMDYMAELHELPRYSMLAGFLQYFGPDVEVVDVGCGQGLLRRQIAPGSFARYVGIDPTPAAIERAKTLEDERTSFLVGDISVVGDRRFDVAMCNEVLSMVPEPEALLDGVTGVLKPGGIVLTSIWRHPGDRVLWKLLDERLERVDVVKVRNESSRLARFGWRVGCHRKRSD